MRKELVKLYREFCEYVIETNPNYVDSDFSFENFIRRGEMSHLCRKCGKEMPKDRKGSEQVCPECSVNKKLLDILIELGNTGIKGSLKPNEYYLNKCRQAHDQIMELWRGGVR